MASLVGRTIGKYEVVDLIGKGGMATVYKGYQSVVERTVAIKVLPPSALLDTMFVERFQLEARTIAKLQHPHILQLFDYGAEDDLVYFVTAFVDGGSLDRRIKRLEILDVTMTERLLREIAGALDYAHRQGVIHRDIKPANILLDNEGHAFLADFGIAKIASSSANLTGTGVVGTPAYMAPEQIEGEDLDGRSDIYSMGCVVFEMLTGRPPYVGEQQMQLMVKHLQDPVPRITDINSSLPPGLDAVMLTVLDKFPENRYQTASEFAEAFSAAIHGDTSLAHVRARMPLNTKGMDDAKTTPAQPITNVPRTRGGTPTPSMPLTPTPGTGTGPQTVIVQQTLDTRILIAGFAVLGLLMVVGITLILVVSNQPQEPTPLRDLAELRVTQRSEVVGAVGSAVPQEQPSAVTPIPIEDLFDSVGQVRFGTTNQLGDSISLTAGGFPRPDDGFVYVGWLVDTRTDAKLNIGRVTVDGAGDANLTYVNPEGVFLPGFYNSASVTIERVEDQDEVNPAGPVMFSGSNPPEVMDVLDEIFIASEDGFRGRGLLDSALQEARFATQHAGLAAQARNVGGLRDHTEHTLNILFGTETDYDANGRGVNPGAGIGLLPLLDAIDARLASVTGAGTASTRLQTDAETIRVCIVNVRTWANEVVELEQAQLEAESLEEVAEELARSTELTAQLTTGIDLNENGTIDPFEGECGLQQIRNSGVLVASIDLLDDSE